METSLRQEALDILDCFLFEEINNNRNPCEDDWAITWVGNDFLLRHYDTGEVFNFRVEISPGTLTPEEIKQAGDDQEWWDE